MRISARLDLVFRDGSDLDLRGIAGRVGRQGGEVRWRTGENDSRELHVRFAADDEVHRWLTEIAENYLYGR